MSPVVAIALLAYTAFLLFYVVWSLFLGYHLLRFAPQREVAVIHLWVFVGVTVFLLLVSVGAFVQLDWAAPF